MVPKGLSLLKDELQEPPLNAQRPTSSHSSSEHRDPARLSPWPQQWLHYLGALTPRATLPPVWRHVSALVTGLLSIWWRPSSATEGLEKGMDGFWENSWQWEKQALLSAFQVHGHGRLLMIEHHNWELRKGSRPLTLDRCFPRLYQDAAQLGLYFY